MWLFVHITKRIRFRFDEKFVPKMDRFEKLKCKQLRGFGNLSYSIIIMEKVNSSGCLANRNTIPIMTFQRRTLTHTRTSWKRKKRNEALKKPRQYLVVQQKVIFDVFYLFTIHQKEMKNIYSFLSFCHLLVCLMLFFNLQFPNMNTLNVYPTKNE